MKFKLLGVIAMAVAGLVNAEESYEIVSFSYKEDVSFETQKSSTESLNSIVSQYPGFISRKFFFSKENNRWFDLVVWESIDKAKAASEQAMNNPEALKVFSLMDEDSMIFSHYKALGGINSQ